MPTDQEIKDAYTSFENERDNKLPKRQVSRALRALGIPVTEAEVQKLLGTGKELSIDFNTFKSIVSQASQVQHPSLQSTIESASALFKTEDGKINLQDMKQVLAIVCEKLEDDDIEEFLANAVVDSNGNITVQDFAKLFA